MSPVKGKIGARGRLQNPPRAVNFGCRDMSALASPPASRALWEGVPERIGPEDPAGGQADGYKERKGDRLLESFSVASYEASLMSNAILTSSLALTPAFPGGLMPKSVCFTVASPV